MRTKTYMLNRDACHWKVGIRVFQVVLDALSPNPRCHLDDELSLYTYTQFLKCILGQGGGVGGTWLYTQKKASTT